jgi:CRISPR-associated protein Cas1
MTCVPAAGGGYRTNTGRCDMEKKLNLFVTEQGSTIRVEGRRVVVSKGREQLVDVPLLHLREIVIFGNSTITPQAVSRVLREGIYVVFLSQYGKFNGILLPSIHSDGAIRLKQVAKSEDSSFCLRFSKEIINAKLHNSIELLSRKRKKEVEISSEISELQKMQEKIKNATSLKELLGLEGVSSKIYFSSLAKIFNSEFSFEGRKKHPSPDPLNALLSLSYSLLYSLCYSFIYTLGLDPHIGFFHEMRRGHAALASDMCEEFRAPICDSLVLRLVNQGYFTSESFTYQGEGVFLKKEALKKFLKEWAGNLDRRVDVDGSFETSYWHLIEFQVQKLRKAVVEDEDYKAFYAGEEK